VVVLVWGALHRARSRMMAEDRARKNLGLAPAGARIDSDTH